MRLNASFRDPSGFVFERAGVLYRQVNRGYERDIQALFESGLQDELTRAGLVIACDQAPVSLAETDTAAMVVQPERVPLVSYPYEWCFSQLKEAALLTLDVAERALEKGMVLKDATAYNVQFLRGRPVLIDTLSFERYRDGNPWVAYAQFCRHFLAPLALMSIVDVRLGSLSRAHLDGVPLDLASRMLPFRTRLSPGLLLHIHLHANAIASAEQSPAPSGPSRVASLKPLLSSLRSTVSRLRWEPVKSRWSQYADIANYSDRAMDEKKRIVREMIEAARPASKVCWDIGANTGEFSAIAANLGYEVIAWDSDPSVVEVAARQRRESVLPLLMDLTNPSPSQGWAHEERDSFVARGPAGVVLALALIHHLAIGNNVPLPMVAKFLASISEWAIVEFVPKEDSQIARMLRAREDVFGDYHRQGFEDAMGSYFEIVDERRIDDTERILYLLRKS